MASRFWRCTKLPLLYLFRLFECLNFKLDSGQPSGSQTLDSQPQKTNLWTTYLRSTNLWQINLQTTNFRATNLWQINLRVTNHRATNVWQINLWAINLQANNIYTSTGDQPLAKFLFHPFILPRKVTQNPTYHLKASINKCSKNVAIDLAIVLKYSGYVMWFGPVLDQHLWQLSRLAWKHKNVNTQHICYSY